MKVAHIIPSAFEYFNDIRSEAFALAESLNKQGIEVRAFTLQYGKEPSAKIKKEIKQTAPLRAFGGLAKLPEVLQSLDQFDLVHLHCPMFGGLGKIIKWKKQHLDQPLVITFYRPPIISDLMSYFVKWYNAIYLPKILALANVVAGVSQADLPKNLVKKIQLFINVDYSSNFYDLDLTQNEDGVKLTPEERLAVKYLLIYQQLVKQP